MGPCKNYVLSFCLLFLGVGCAKLGVPASGARVLDPGSSSGADFLIARQLELDGQSELALTAYQRAVEADPYSPYLLRRVAELAWRLGKFEQTKTYAEQAHLLDPADPENRFFLGKIYQIAKRDEEAMAILVQEDGQPVSTDAGSLLFGMQMNKRDFEASLATAQWILEQEPERLRSYLFMAAIHNELGQFEQAEAVYREGLKVSPGNLAIYGDLARTERARGNTEAEIAIYREILEIYPHHHPTLSTLAETQENNRQLEDSISTLKEILNFYPDDARAVLRLALLEYQSENYEDSAFYFETLLAGDGSRYEIRFFLALVQLKLGQEEEALENFAQVPPDHPRYVEARTQLAAYWEQRQEWGKALVELKKIQLVRPSPALDLYTASMMAKDGQIKEAIEFVEKLQNADPDDEELLFNLGVLYGEEGSSDRSLDVMHEVLELNPDHPGALNYIGYSWAEKGIRLLEAEAMILRALAQRPNDAYITDSLGWVYYMRGIAMRDSGGYDEATGLLKQSVKELEKAVQLADSDPVISEHLGDAYLALDEKRRALESYRKALEGKKSGAETLIGKFEKLRMELGVK
jgi:tetratricopeptide (TPR) repeat protein